MTTYLDFEKPIADLESKIHLAEALANQATLAVQMARLGEQADVREHLPQRGHLATGEAQRRLN